MLKKISVISLSVILGVIFIFSGISKLFPIELLELNLIELGVSNWLFAPFISRILIGFELILGISLIIQFRLKRLTIPLVMLTLTFFTFYLSWTLIKYGDKGNCNCFGTIIKMTPVESIIKNVILLILSSLIYWKYPLKNWKFDKIVLTIATIISLSLPFILNPVNINASENNFKEKINYELALKQVYENSAYEKPTIELRKGKHIIAFMSLTCPHCRIAAYKMHVINKNNPSIPLYLFLNGDKTDLQPFFDESKVENIPHSMLPAKPFIEAAGVKLPAIFWIENGIVKKRTKYISLNQKEIEDWLK